MTHNSTIPLVDLVASHAPLEEELVSIFRGALRTAEFVGGAVVEEFEREFACYCDARFCVGVGSGTDALRFALIAAGVRRGDAVVTVPNTFIATTEAISQAGACPDFVDVDERTHTMDWEKLREFLQDRCYRDPSSGRLFSQRSRRPVTAIVPVHLYGQMAAMDPILELAAQHNLIVIEDACQAHGAQYFSEKEGRWEKAGSMGHAAAFSFYPGKNLGACGEAGAVTTNHEKIARTVRMLRNHGQAHKYYHDIEGYNGRLDAVQAGILHIKLTHLPEWNARRRENALCYKRLFAPLAESMTVPYEPPWARSVYHLYVMRTANRDSLRAHLAGVNIATGVHYPVPLHLQKAYRFLAYKRGDFPIAEKLASEILSLPMYPELRSHHQRRITNQVVEFTSAKLNGSEVKRSVGNRIYEPARS